MIIVSACLAGVNCRYDGNNNRCPAVQALIKKGRAIPVCPEQLGGLPTPRAPAEIKKGIVLTNSGADVTKQFKSGTKQALKIAKLSNCSKAILKARSPSCGIGKIYNGNFDKTLTQGNGIFAQALIDANISVITEEEL